MSARPPDHPRPIPRSQPTLDLQWPLQRAPLTTEVGKHANLSSSASLHRIPYRTASCRPHSGRGSTVGLRRPLVNGCGVRMSRFLVARHPSDDTRTGRLLVMEGWKRLAGRVGPAAQSNTPHSRQTRTGIGARPLGVLLKPWEDHDDGRRRRREAPKRGRAAMYDAAQAGAPEGQVALRWSGFAEESARPTSPGQGWSAARPGRRS